MAKKKKKTAPKKEKKEKGKQLDLIDVAPENAKPIIAKGRRYKKVQATRLAALAEEKKLKEEIKSDVKAANLQPLKGGVIKFKYNGVTIIITPQDEKVEVKEDKDA